MAAIALRGVAKRFDATSVAVDDVSLEIADGEFLVLVGPSGCGKTTLLRMIAGLEQPSKGRIEIDGQDVTGVDPQDRDLAMVFQSYALYPHMTVAGNLAFGLEQKRLGKNEIRQRVAEVAEMLDLTELLRRRPASLSGGQRQRVAMGRAIARDARAFLMDEPLSNLDAKLRVRLRAELGALKQRLGTTTVYVTHDQLEAMTLGDRVAVMHRGVIQQIDAPPVLFSHPANLMVAAFMGSPPMNLVEAAVDHEGIEFGGHRVSMAGAPALANRAGQRVIVGIRPHDLYQAGGPRESDQSEILVKPAIVERLGTETRLVFHMDAPSVLADELLTAPEIEGDRPADSHSGPVRARTEWNAVLPANVGIAPGDDIRLALDTRDMHFFDPATGVAIERGRARTPQEAFCDARQ